MTEMTRHMVVRGLMFSLLGLGGMGCTPAFEGEYSDPAKVEIVDDRWNETDARRTAEEMIKDCLSGAWLKEFTDENKGKKPVVMVDELQNKTQEHIDTQAITEQIRTELVNSRSVKFINAERRQKVADEIQYQNSGAVDPAMAKKLGKQYGADFMLGGVMSDSVHTQGGLKVITYQINIALTNLTTTEMVWTKQFNIKKRMKRSGSSW
jgi:penicillin-binding protein activator